MSAKPNEMSSSIDALIKAAEILDGGNSHHLSAINGSAQSYSGSNCHCYKCNSFTALSDSAVVSLLSMAGIASPMKDVQPSLQNSTKSIIAIDSRKAHNQLEKHRRADLKVRFDRLKEHVPSTVGKRCSNLAILRSASRYIQRLRQRTRQHEAEQSELVERRTSLASRLDDLQRQVAMTSRRSSVGGVPETSPPPVRLVPPAPSLIPNLPLSPLSTSRSPVPLEEEDEEATSTASECGDLDELTDEASERGDTDTTSPAPHNRPAPAVPPPLYPLVVSEVRANSVPDFPHPDPQDLPSPLNIKSRCSSSQSDLPVKKRKVDWRSWLSDPECSGSSSLSSGAGDSLSCSYGNTMMATALCSSVQLQSNSGGSGVALGSSHPITTTTMDAASAPPWTVNGGLLRWSLIKPLTPKPNPTNTAAPPTPLSSSSSSCSSCSSASSGSTSLFAFRSTPVDPSANTGAVATSPSVHIPLVLSKPDLPGGALRMPVLERTLNLTPSRVHQTNSQHSHSSPRPRPPSAPHQSPQPEPSDGLSPAWMYQRMLPVYRLLSDPQNSGPLDPPLSPLPASSKPSLIATRPVESLFVHDKASSTTRLVLSPTGHPSGPILLMPSTNLMPIHIADTAAGTSIGLGKAGGTQLEAALLACPSSSANVNSGNQHIMSFK